MTLKEELKLMINAHYLAESKVRSVGDTRERTGDSAMWQGYQQGKKVKINHGVKGKEQAKLTMKS